MEQKVQVTLWKARVRKFVMCCHRAISIELTKIIYFNFMLYTTLLAIWQEHRQDLSEPVIWLVRIKWFPKYRPAYLKLFSRYAAERVDRFFMEDMKTDQ